MSEKKCGGCQKVYGEDAAAYLSKTSRWRMDLDESLWFNCTCGSTLVLTKTRYVGRDSDGVEMISLARPQSRSLFTRLMSKRELFPRISPTAIAISSMLDDEGVATSALAREFRREPLLAAEVLGLANTLAEARAEYGDGGAKVASFSQLEHALAYVGRDALREMIVVAELKKLTFDTKRYDKDTFWKDAFFAGHIAEHLAARVLPGRVEPEAAFLGACLADIGKAFGAVLFPDETDRLHLAVSSGEDLSWTEAEEEIGGYDHVALGQIGLLLWGAPLELVYCVEHHHDAVRVEGDERVNFLADVVALSVALTHWLRGDLHRIDHELLQQLRGRLGLCFDHWEKLTDELSRLFQSGDLERVA